MSRIVSGVTAFLGILSFALLLATIIGNSVTFEVSPLPGVDVPAPGNVTVPGNVTATPTPVNVTSVPGAPLWG